MGIVWEGGFKGVGREGARVTRWMCSEYITCVEMSWCNSLLHTLDANKTEMDSNCIAVTYRPNEIYKANQFLWQNVLFVGNVLLSIARVNDSVARPTRFVYLRPLYRLVLVLPVWGPPEPLPFCCSSFSVGQWLPRLRAPSEMSYWKKTLP